MRRASILSGVAFRSALLILLVFAVVLGVAGYAILKATQASMEEQIRSSITEDVELLHDANIAGGEGFAKYLTMLAPFGTAVSYGKLTGKLDANIIDALDKGPGYLHSTAVRIFTMHTLDDKPAIRAQSMNDLVAKLGAGLIRPLIHARLALKDARRAHEMIEARAVIGKIVLKP